MLKVDFLTLSFTYIFVKKYIIIIFFDSMSKYSNNIALIFLHNSHIFYAVWLKTITILSREYQSPLMFK